MVKKDTKSIFVIMVIILIMALSFTFYNVPEGFMEVGNCNEVNNNSEVCFCDEGQIRVYDNVSYSCEVEVVKRQS